MKVAEVLTVNREGDVNKVKQLIPDHIIQIIISIPIPDVGSQDKIIWGLTLMEYFPLTQHDG